MSGTSQFGRALSLIVSKGGSGLELGSLRVRFEITQTDGITPNRAYIRVYNLSDQTAKQVGNEFDKVQLQAGYENGNLSLIFTGNIVQTRRGHEDNVNAYCDIYAADGDKAHYFGILNKTLEAGATTTDQVSELTKAYQQADPDFGPEQPTLPKTGGVLPRGSVLWGYTVYHARRFGMTTDTRLSIQNGKLVAVPIQGYLPGETVVLNSATGLIGFPEVTESGIMATCLLNPKIKIGQRVQIDNKSINSINNRPTQFGNSSGQEISPSFSNPFAGQFASLNADGIYRAMVVNHSGDSRGNPWYSNLVLLNLDPSAPSGSAVSAG